MAKPELPGQDAATVKGDRADSAQSVIDWFQINSRFLSIGAVVVVVAAAGYWFWLRSSELKTANAEKMLNNARQSLGSGNPALAQSDLGKIVSRYGGTRPGIEAAMLLATTDYDQKKYPEGIKVLEDVVGNRAASATQATIYGLIGDGYAQEKKLADAAKSYEKAASATDYPAEKAFNEAKAARTYAQAGDSANARRLWGALVESKVVGVATEAKIRLAELTVTPAGKS